MDYDVLSGLRKIQAERSVKPRDFWFFSISF